jgi:acetylglutamate synthase
VDNPVTQWYFEQTESSYSEKQWVAFTKGLKDFERIRRCKVDCLARPISWVDE